VSPDGQTLAFRPGLQPSLDPERRQRRRAYSVAQVALRSQPRYALIRAAFAFFRRSFRRRIQHCRGATMRATAPPRRCRAVAPPLRCCPCR